LQPLPAIIIIGAEAITANSASAFVIGDQTLEAGRQITYAGTILSLAADGRALNIDATSTQILDLSYLIGTKTLQAGAQAVTAAGEIYSLLPGASSVVIDGTTQEETEAASSIQKICVPAFVIGSQTLIAGGQPLTLSGTVMSLEPNGETAVIGGSVTEDMSAWFQRTASSRGSSAEHGTISASEPQVTNYSASNGNVFISASGRIQGNWWVAWLAVVITIISAAETIWRLGSSKDHTVYHEEVLYDKPKTNGTFRCGKIDFMCSSGKRKELPNLYHKLRATLLHLEHHDRKSKMQNHQCSS
jgi:hypothetical protein